MISQDSIRVELAIIDLSFFKPQGLIHLFHWLYNFDYDRNYWFIQGVYNYDNLEISIYLIFFGKKQTLGHSRQLIDHALQFVMLNGEGGDGAEYF